MRSEQRTRGRRLIAPAALVIAGALLFSISCAEKPAWTAKNAGLIAAQNLPVRTRADIPAVPLKPSLAPGVKAAFYWGKGNLVAWLTFDPGAAIPEETLPAERIMVVMKGAIDQLVG